MTHPQPEVGWVARWLAHPSMALVAAVAPLLMVGLLAPAYAQDKAEIDRTQILGNRELPKVLTIVPWKRPLPGELAGKPPTSLVDEVLQPIDRDVFRRQVAYDSQIHGPPAARAKPSAAAIAPLPSPSATTPPSDTRRAQP